MIPNEDDCNKIWSDAISKANDRIRQKFCDEYSLTKHVANTAKLAKRFAQTVDKANLDIVYASARLHDVGALLENTDYHLSNIGNMHHPVTGAIYLKTLDIDQRIIQCVATHVGGGITRDEAHDMNFPDQWYYTPETTNEILASHADSHTKLHSIPFGEILDRVEYPKYIVKRMKALKQKADEILGQNSNNFID